MGCIRFSVSILFVGVIVCFSLSMLSLSQRDNGCYVKNGIGACDYTMRSVTINNFTCVDDCLPRCNCNNCANSDFCNCDLIMCNVVGEYDNQKCNINKFNYLEKGKPSVSDVFSYTDTYNTFQINTTYNMFSKKEQNDKCFLKNQIISNGKEYYDYVVVGISAPFIFVTMCVLSMCDKFLDNNDHITTTNNNNVNNINDVEIGNLNNTTPIQIEVDNINTQVIPSAPCLPHNNYIIVNKYDNDVCSICICEIDKNKKYILLNCLHAFHEDCIKLLLNDNCPLCLCKFR